MKGDSFGRSDLLHMLEMNPSGMVSQKREKPGREEIRRNGAAKESQHEVLKSTAFCGSRSSDVR